MTDERLKELERRFAEWRAMRDAAEQTAVPAADPENGAAADRHRQVVALRDAAWRDIEAASRGGDFEAVVGRLAELVVRCTRRGMSVAVLTRPCRHCGKAFEVRGTKSCVKRLFCSDACKCYDYRRRKADPGYAPSRPYYGKRKGGHDD